MVHRIRWAMTDKNPTALTGVVEADETYVGGKLRGHRAHRIRGQTMRESVKQGFDKKTQVVGMLERGGRVRALSITEQGKHMNKKQMQATLTANIDIKSARLMTDEHRYYDGISKYLPHGMIRHESEYVRGEVHTNGIEGFWSHLKRGIIGTYFHVDAGYLNQYVQEFAFRHNTRENTDRERFTALLGQVEGRLDWYVGKNAAS